MAPSSGSDSALSRWLNRLADPDLDPARADADGLVAVGGDLRPARLLEAYRRGVFPWYSDGLPVLWWSPDPRAVIPLDGFHLPRRMVRTIRAARFRVTINRDFAGVVAGCADRPEGTWITSDMAAAYAELHHLGLAHSVEVWAGEALAGGLYGVALGGFFAGESMFTRVRDASKVALAATVGRLSERGFALFDVQYATAHTARLGAAEIPRAEYLVRLRRALAVPARFD